MVEIPRLNYEAVPLETKFGWMRGGDRAARCFTAGDGLRRIASRLADSDLIVGDNLTRRLGLGWQGSAAGAAGESLGRTAASLAATGSSAGSGGGAMRGYGDSFVAASNAIPEPVVIGQNSFWGEQADDIGRAARHHVGTDFGIQSDFTRRLAEYRAADQAATEALRRHEDATRQSLALYAATVVDPAGGSSGAGGGGQVETAGNSPGPGGPGGGSGPGAVAAGAPGGGAAGAGAGGSGGGGITSAAGAAGSAGSAAAGAGPGDVWTPIGTEAASAPAGLVPGPNGGYVPAANTPAQHIQTSLPVAPSPGTGTRGGYAGGYAGGYRGAGGQEPLAARGGSAAGTAPAGGTGGGGAPGAGRAGAGMPPMGMGGMSPGGQGRDHRNEHFMPSDEPFRVEHLPDGDGFAVSPGVLGVPDPVDGWLPHERW